MTQRLLPLTAFVLLAACATTPAAKPDDATASADAGVDKLPLTAPDPAKLLAAAEHTQQVIESGEPYATRATHFVNNVRIVVEQAFVGGVWRIDFTAESDAGPQRVATIIDRPDRWEVRTSREAAEVTRPWEAVLPLPLLYELLRRSDLRVVNKPLLTQGTFKHYDEGQAVFAVPLPPDKREQLQRVLATLDKTPADARFEGRRKAFEQLLKDGQSVWVDPATGVISAVGTPAPQAVQGFAELKKPPANLFDIGVTGAPPPAPSAEALGDMVMIGYSAAWRAGGKSQDLDTVLLDVSTGKVRRVPVRKALAMPGSFLPGRAKVVVAANTGESAMRPMEVDLASGSNRLLGGDALAAGNAVFPVVSPDGKKVAVSMLSQGESVLDHQLVVVDLATDRVTKVGPAMEHAFVSWLPKGDGFVLLRREAVEGQEERKKVIGRLGLDGAFTPIIEGDHPVLLADGKTILFEGEGRLWRTCTLAGKDVKLFGDGFKGYTFPAPSPDGKRLVMMHAADQGPRPVLVDLKTKDVKNITDLPGLFSWPAWR